MCDYFSNYIEVERLTTTTSQSVAQVLSSLFARHGVPDVLVSDNGPQFVSAEFASFAKKWKFDHVTSSPHYAQSNGKAENAVKTARRMEHACFLRSWTGVIPHLKAQVSVLLRDL